MNESFYNCTQKMDICKFLHEYVLFNMSGSLMFLWKIIFLLFLFCSVACTGRCLCITNTRCTYKKLTVWNLSLKGKWNLPFHIKYPVLICRIISWLIGIRGKGNGVKYLLRFWFLCGPSECGMLWFYLMNCKIRLKLIWNEWCEFVWRDHVKGS